MLLIGGALGSAVAGYFEDLWGRKTILIVNNLFYIVGSIVTALAVNEGMLIAGRFIYGIGAGVATSVGPVYFNEISPSKLRGAVGALHEVSFNIGVLVSMICGLFLSTVPNWRWLVAIPCIFSVLQLIMMPFSVQTPKWLVMKGDNKDSYVSLKLLHSSYSEGTLKREMAEILDSQDPAAAEYKFWHIVTHPKLRVPLYVAIFFQVAQQFSGINAVYFYSTSMFDETNPGISSYMTLVIGILSVLACAISAYLMDRAGRKLLSLIGLGGMCIIAVLFTIAFRFNIPGLSDFCIYGYVAFFSVSMGPIPFVILPEYFPTQAVGDASSIAMVINWLGGYVIGQVFPLMSAGLGDYAFLPFAGFLAASFVIALIFIPETKGKPLPEILKDLGV